MLDPEIMRFFEDRKAGWLKKNLKASMTDIEVKEKEIECDENFSLKQWLPNAAKRAGQISISTHPCTFSHPSSRKNKNGYATSIIASSKQCNDGFLRSGNVDVVADALGNAAALDVYKFLMLVMEDGQNLIQHLEQDSDLAVKFFTLAKDEGPLSYQSLKDGFLTMTSAGNEKVTSSKIKQVYFPLNNEGDYHQLSLLTASGILFEQRKRIDGIRFGDEIKIAREKKKVNQEHGAYKEIYNLTTIGYGGTKPQNISVLNNQNGGKAHMFMSAPPQLKNRDTHFPSVDFFSQSIRYFHCKYQFQQLHVLYQRDDNNMHIRAERDDFYQSVIDYVIEKMWQVRDVASEQYREESNHLPKAQKIWLCDQYEEQRMLHDDCLDTILKGLTAFLFHGYEKILGKKVIKLGDAEYKHMQSIVTKNKEALR